MIIKDKPSSFNELRFVIDEYAEYCKTSTIIPIDKKLLFDKIVSHVRDGGFFRIIYNDNNIVGYGICLESEAFYYSHSRGLTQIFYGSTKRGPIAVKAMVLFHKEMENYAKAKRLKYCMSSSDLDNNVVFNRILASQGWIPNGSGMIKIMNPLN